MSKFNLKKYSQKSGMKLMPYNGMLQQQSEQSDLDDKGTQEHYYSRLSKQHKNPEGDRTYQVMMDESRKNAASDKVIEKQMDSESIRPDSLHGSRMMPYNLMAESYHQDFLKAYRGQDTMDGYFLNSDSEHHADPGSNRRMVPSQYGFRSQLQNHPERFSKLKYPSPLEREPDEGQYIDEGDVRNMVYTSRDYVSKKSSALLRQFKEAELDDLDKEIVEGLKMAQMSANGRIKKK